MKKLLPIIRIKPSVLRIKGNKPCSLPLVKGKLRLFFYHNSNLGFTLIELMVVVSIIAILSVVAIALFSNAQKGARDGKRRAELVTIAQTLEINKGPNNYQPLQAAFFTGGTFPGGGATAATDPSGWPYCIGYSSVPPVPPYDYTPIGYWSSSTCGGGGSYVQVSTTTPTANTKYWKICATLETTSSSICMVNSQ